MTVADDIHRSINHLMATGSEEERRAFVSRFFQRFVPGYGSISDIRHSPFGFEMRVESPLGEVFWIDYDQQQNRFRGFSDASLAEFLQVPVAFINGVTFSITHLTEKLSEIERALKKAQLHEVKAKQQRQRVAKERLKYRQVLSDEKNNTLAQRLAVHHSREFYKQLRMKLATALRQVRLCQERIDYQSSIQLLPTPPPPTITPTRTGDSLPEEPGIYFVWDGNVVVYVGQSIRLKQRATLSHERIKPYHRLSFLTCHKSDLNFNECYYIGLCRPELNFNRT